MRRKLFPVKLIINMEVTHLVLYFMMQNPQVLEVSTPIINSIRNHKTCSPVA
jgi:hypothetical protein